MLENQIGKRYAEALSGNIGEDYQLGDALQSLKKFDEAMKTEKQLLRFFEHPSISTEKKKNVFEELVLGQFLTRNTISATKINKINIIRAKIIL